LDDNIKIELREIKYISMDRIHMAHDRVQWLARLFSSEYSNEPYASIKTWNFSLPFQWPAVSC